MATKFTTSINIIRDTNREINYIPTPNAIRIADQIGKDYEQGLRSFNIIGSYGTGKSSFLWAFEQTVKKNRNYFGLDLIKNAKVKFIKIVGSFRPIREALMDALDIDAKMNSPENIFTELFNIYHDLGSSPLLVIEIDEFGKFLEYASKNNPENELYFIQQFTEFLNNPDLNILLLTTVHQNFDAYALGLSKLQRQEWAKVKGRFKEITFNEPIEQLLYLAAEHLEEKASSNFENVKIDNILKLLIDSKVFTVNENYIKNIAEKIFPLEIFSAFLITTSLQKYGQNERSLFSFLESTDHTSLYQHYILNKGLYTIADVYDYLIYNFFSFINSRYNPDFSGWKNIKSTLERVESSFDENIEDYIKVVKTIGLLSFNAKAGAILDYNFFSQYAELCLSIKDAGKLLANLEKKKIVLYRNYSNRYILADGTDLDIEGALFEAAKKIEEEVKDVVTLLKKNYPLSPILAKRAMFDTGAPRLFEYVISSEAITQKPVGEIDGFVNLIFNDRNILPEIISTSKECKEAILYCYYKNSGDIQELLFEIEKTQRVIEENQDDKVAITELQNIIVHQRNLLNYRIIHSLFIANTPVIWIFDGREHILPTQKDFNKFLSEICKTVYDKTPYFNNELVNKHKISTSIHTAKRNYFKALVQNWDVPHLGFPEDKFPPEKTIYLSLLENNGIRLYDNSLSSIIEPHNENGFKNLWDASVDFMNSSKTSKRRITELADLLNNKPFKLKQGLIDFWIPTFLFIKRDEYALFGSNGYIPYITEEILDLISKRPFEFEIKAFALDGVRVDIFNSYRTIINLQSKTNISNESFIETIKPFLIFYKKLPLYSKITTRLSKEAISIRKAISDSKDPEETFFEDFPSSLGYSIKTLQNDRTALIQYVTKLQDSIKELRNCYDGLIDRFETFLQDKYFNNEFSFEGYQEAFQKRYKKLHRHLLVHSQKTFVMRLDSKIDVRNAWLNALAQVLVGKTLENFKDEDELILYDKFQEMILSLDSLNKISETKFDESKEYVLDININSFQDGPMQKIIRLPKEKNHEVTNLEKNIKQLLSKDRQTDLAALASVLKQLLE
ncbi:hypothetical protein IX39_12330 [Chryseobacterium formosense]|uniref:ATP-binding protein n=1 Tax=Chryseobacterium formosense TaxID=236814 RepID=A0A085ZA91_9FLAO|nr:hypothetical protein [Chryseobacterium formosense]KFF01355.1 hypothetical protein IX39_12330 [Chryseobacterium formosense]SFT46156.1 hypothetical protein SAMN05421857_1155 [Chryseobacterium formosense]